MGGVPVEALRIAVSSARWQYTALISVHHILTGRQTIENN